MKRRIHLAERIIDRFALDCSAGPNRELNEELLTLSGGRKGAVREYHIRKWNQLFWVCAVVGMLLAMALGSAFLQDTRILDGRLQRPKPGEAAWQQELTLELEETVDPGRSDKMTLAVEVAQRQYSEQEKQALLAQARAELEEMLPGENRSRDEIRSALVLPDELQNGAVQVEWNLTPYGVILEHGEIGEDVSKNGTLVTLEAVLTCQQKTERYETAVRVYPPIPTEEKMLETQIREALTEADMANAQEEFMPLPSVVGDWRLLWRKQPDRSWMFLALLCLLAPIFWHVFRDQRVHEQAAKRREQLEEDYPELMWKMTLLLGAGLSLRNAFFRIAKEGAGGKDLTASADSKNIRYVYREMQIACREMQSGVPEGRAYENFGRRCALPRYVRLGSVLSQNLRKGSRGLMELLEKEAQTTTMEQRAKARKMGEKAGTKLLFPMMLMLGVVMAVLIIPAFLSI